MIVKYSIEIAYKVSEEYKYSQLELMKDYMKIIKENPEISQKDKVLNTLGSKYNSFMRNHDFDILFGDLTTKESILQRNTNFQILQLRVLNFIKELSGDYYITSVTKIVGEKQICIFSINGETDYKKLDDIDTEIRKLCEKYLDYDTPYK